MPTGNETVHWVVHKRSDLLRVLCEGEYGKPALSGALDVSRSTVDRAILDLERFGLVERRQGTFSATLSGRLVHQSYERFVERFEDLVAMQPVLEHVSLEDHLDPVVLEGAAVYLEGAAPPDDIDTQLTMRDASVERIKSVTTTISRKRSARRLHTHVTDRDIEFTGIYAVDLASFFNAWADEDRREMAESGNYRAYVTTRETPFTVYLYYYPDRAEVFVFVYDDDEDLVGVIINETEAAVEWGESHFEESLADAFEITDQI